MKYNKPPFPCFLATLFLCFALVCQHTYAEEETKQAADSNADTASVDTERTPANTSEDKKKSLKHAADKRLELLRKQYPARELVELSANDETFSALWRKDRSGDALGAVLLVPALGQTANWPNTIDVLRNELPQTGWSTLSIDLKAHSWDENIETTQEMSTDNKARIRSAVEFLHEKGQFNIVLAGYGESANRILDYSGQGETGMKKNVPSSRSTQKKRPIRALIMIAGSGYQAMKLSPALESYVYQDMPILDVVFGSHYLDTHDAQARKKAARSNGFSKYIQIKTVEPNSHVFESENRLSRRVRGFLERYAKGVEIDRR
jgi:hypothetical protein